MKDNQIRKQNFWLFSLVICVGCAVGKKFTHTEEVETSKAKDTTAEKFASIDLKQAKVWSRLDEMEQELTAHREKIKLLEKALLLGINPEKTTSGPRVIEHDSRSDQRITPSEIEVGTSNLPPSDKLVVQDKSESVLESRIKGAKALFDAGRYSKAYLEFARIDRELAQDDKEGAAKFWVGRSWLQLNEYQNAKQVFNELVAKYPDSSFLAPAKYYLAQSELALGLREQAVAHLQELIMKHPYESAAEEAKVVLQNMTKTL